jgi:hypothetical protein
MTRIVGDDGVGGCVHRKDRCFGDGNSAGNIGQHISLPTSSMQNAPVINNINYVYLQ